jgi:UDP-4-amino-4,6-dideoxy-N-acetyl-beta-L-altrosamine transaminase
MRIDIIPYGKHKITDEDINAVIGILKSDHLTQGPEIGMFEKKFAEYIGAKHAVAVSNGTAALHLCAMAIGVQRGDKVITTPITFAASANCVRYCGGEVVFADIDPSSFLLDFDKLEKMLSDAPSGTYKGIIPVDFAGYPYQMDRLRRLANQYGMWIIEDACHAPGAFFTDANDNKQLSGNGVYADLSIFSFHPVKHIATGEGGMITTNSDELYEKLLVYRTHGITRDEHMFVNTPSFACGQDSEVYPGWYMEMQELGYNYRLTDIQAGLGRSQLERAEENLERRRLIALKYDEAFKDHKDIVSPQLELAGDTSFAHAYHLYVIRVKNRLGLYNYLRGQRIYCQVHYIPTHLMPYYKALGWKEGNMPEAEAYYKECLSLPMYPTLTDEEQQYVIERINAFYTR